MKRLSLAAILCTVLAWTPDASSDVRIVPDDFSSIQQAIDASVSGDTVLVEPGTYFETLHVANKDVVLHSTGGPEVTVIDAEGLMGSVVYLDGVGTGTELVGFTLTNGTGTADGAITRGGGVLVRYQVEAGPLIRSNHIIANQAGEGGGVFLWGSGRITHNLIAFNNALVTEGGGILTSNSSQASVGIFVTHNDIYHNESATQCGGAVVIGEMPVTFSDNVVAFNTSDLTGGACVGGFPETIERNTIVGNLGETERGGLSFGLDDENLTVLTANIVAFNFNGGISCSNPFGDGLLDATCNVIFGNYPDLLGDPCIVLGENGNEQVDPLLGVFEFEEPFTNNFCLGEGSPALPENAPPGCGLIGAVGACPPIAVEDVEPAAPRALGFAMARPNPFVSRTTIPLVVSEPGEVEIAVYDALGRKVRELHRGWLVAGEHLLAWDGRDEEGRPSPSGVYIAKVRQGDTVRRSRALLLVR